MKEKNERQQSIREMLGEPTFGEKFSAPLHAISVCIWERKANMPNDKPCYTDEGFEAAVNLFFDVILDRMYDYQERLGLLGPLREKMAVDCGNDVRRIILQYTDVDTRKLAKDVMNGIEKE